MSTKQLTLAPHLADPLNVSTETPEFGVNDLSAAAAHYEEMGYVVIRGAFDPAQAVAVNDAFERTVRPYDGYIYRQTTCNPELHRFSEHGLMMNPILNVQDLPSNRFREFRAASLEIITNSTVRALNKALFDGDQGKLVQSMYFQGNPATWAHQDSYYLDSEHIGRMAAGWFALEDIDARAGRFYVYPKSHQVDMFRNGGKFDVAFNHGRYKQLVLDTIDQLDLECKAPALAVGDAIFWNAKTIHGSLATTDGAYGRRSLTAHYLPTGDRFLQHQTRTRPLSISTINGYQVHSPKSLDKVSRRTVLKVETSFPQAFKVAKKGATKAMITVNGLRRRG